MTVLMTEGGAGIGNAVEYRFELLLYVDWEVITSSLTYSPATIENLLTRLS